MATAPQTPGIEVGRVVSRAFEALTANILPFFALALLLLGLPGFLGQYFLLSGFETAGPVFTGGPERFGTTDPLVFLTANYWVPVLVAGVATVLGYVFLQVVLTRSTILHLSGRAPDMAGSAMLALRLLLPIIGLIICVSVLLMIGFICLIFPAVMIWCALIVAVPALVEERRGVFASIARSRELTRGSRWRIFLLVVLTWIFSMIVSAITGAIAGASMTMTANPVMPDPLLAGAANGIGSALTGLVATAVIAALYVELREVKEGTGADTLAGVFG
jgi:hypothetical protein